MTPQQIYARYEAGAITWDQARSEIEAYYASVGAADKENLASAFMADHLYERNQTTTGVVGEDPLITQMHNSNYLANPGAPLPTLSDPQPPHLGVVQLGAAQPTPTPTPASTPAPAPTRPGGDEYYIQPVPGPAPSPQPRPTLPTSSEGPTASDGSFELLQSIVPPVGPALQQQAAAATSPDFQETAFERQEERRPFDVHRRYLGGLPGFNETGPFVRNALEAQASDQFSRYLLNTIGQPEQNFFDYLGGDRLGGSGLGAALGQVEDIVTADPSTLSPYQLATRATYDTEDQEEAFRAALQPTLFDVAPALRGAFSTGAADRFSQFRAERPEDRWLTYARQKGFFP